MKKLLLATSVLAASTGFAAAEVTLSGDARMGIIDPFGSGNANGIAFTSRARVTFTLSGETDSGLAFGGSFRADNAGGITVQDANGDGVIDPTDPNEVNNGGAALGRAGSVFVSGSFGKLSMGDVDNAALAAVGQVSGVGLTGLGDLNELTYMSDTGTFNDPTALYEFSTNGFTIMLSATNPNSFEYTNAAGDTLEVGQNDSIAIGAQFAIDAYSFGLGYENTLTGGNQSNLVVGASGTFGGVTLKGVYGYASGDIEGDQYAVSADFAVDAFGITVFYSDEGGLNFDETGVQIGDAAYGIGVSYDLGGGASLVGGYAYDTKDDGTGDDLGGAWDMGISMSF